VFTHRCPHERVVTSGTFELDGGSWDVDNNLWIVGDDSRVIVIDAAHSAAPIVGAVDGRHVVAVVCTHGHNDHITVAPQLGADLDAPVLLNPADDSFWLMTHGDKAFHPIEDGQVLTADGIKLHAIATPGHSPGSTCLYAPDLGAVVSGDTLFQGGPGDTGRSFSDFPTILGSIKDTLGKLAHDTVVYNRHGDTTKIGDEIVHYDELVTRGH
jgi:glyoxylase-like metal-dependent hydrolase (beta-lactamase superfamily II)